MSEVNIAPLIHELRQIFCSFTTTSDTSPEQVPNSLRYSLDVFESIGSATKNARVYKFRAANRETSIVETSMNEAHVLPVVRSPQGYQVYRIDPDATNRLAIVFDPAVAKQSLTSCIEIFDVGGKTPPNRHQFAVEMFFVLEGEGIAICDGKEVAICSGDSLLVPPTGNHEICNIAFPSLSRYSSSSE